MTREWITNTDVTRNQLEDPIASLSHKGANKIVVKIGDSEQATPHQWRSRKEARRWVEALTVVPVWRKGVYSDYLYEGITIRRPIAPAVVTDDELAFEGDLVEPTDQFLDAATTFEVPSEASIQDLKSPSHVDVADALAPLGTSHEYDYTARVHPVDGTPRKTRRCPDIVWNEDLGTGQGCTKPLDHEGDHDFEPKVGTSHEYGRGWEVPEGTGAPIKHRVDPLFEDQMRKIFGRTEQIPTDGLFNDDANLEEWNRRTRANAEARHDEHLPSVLDLLTAPVRLVGENPETPSLSCGEAVYVGVDFFLCNKSEGHDGAHVDSAKVFRWVDPKFFPTVHHPSPLDPEMRRGVKFDGVAEGFGTPDGLLPHHMLPETDGSYEPLQDPEETEAFESLLRGLLSNSLESSTQCYSKCQVDHSRCTQVLGHEGWHENDSVLDYRTWKWSEEDKDYGYPPDVLNQFLDSLEELGIPETLQLRVQEGDKVYAWRGFYWAVTNEADLLTTPLT